MKILLVNDTAVPAGGAEAMSLTLRQALRARGHDARIFATTALARAGDSFADYTCFGTTSAWRTANRVYNLSAHRALGRVLNQFEPDVVHVRMFLTQLSPAILPPLRRVPSLYHATWYEAICPTGLKMLPDQSICRERAGVACRRHGCLSRRAWGPLMIQRQLFLAWRRAFDMVVANSHALKKRLLEDGIRPVEVIWNGVPRRAPRPPLECPPTASYAGRLSGEKGVDILLRAFARVVKRLPGARLLVAGDGPQRAALEELTARLGLVGQVRMLGHLSRAEMEHRLETAWVQVVPSRLEEPFGLAAAEGMMRGTAVVATDAGGLREIVQHGRTGLRVPPGDVEALAAALLQLLGNRERAEVLGRAGRTRAGAHFSQEACADQFIGLYRLLARERR